MARRKEPVIPDAILDHLLAGSDAKAAFDGGGLIDQLKKPLAERALNAEMDHHLSTDGVDRNSRNGYGKKTVLTDDGSLELSIPRDRQSSFAPQLLAKYQRRFPGFDDKIAKGIEEIFGWGKTVFTLALAAYNIVRLPKLIAATGEMCPHAAR